VTAWAIEGAPNPTVIRVHVDRELTSETIVTCPPGEAPPPLDGLLAIEGVRSLDLHRYMARVNLAAGSSSSSVSADVSSVLVGAWGEPVDLGAEEEPRAFEIGRDGPRRVAESLAMAGEDALLAALFAVAGVAEAIVGEGVALVRLGRLFGWDEAEGPVRRALATS
jgi:hypothetical protein